MTVAGQTERGLVDTVPSEVYLAYEDRAKEIAARAMAETPTAIKNAILRFVLEASLSAALDSGVRPKLTAYELQVLIGTTISGCNMSPDRTFDLPAAWARLKGLGLIDRADGLAIATPAGVELVASAIATQHRREAEAGEPIGYARSVDVDPNDRPMEGRNSFWCAQDQSAYYSVPVYLAASPASGVRVSAADDLMTEAAEALAAKDAAIERLVAEARQAALGEDVANALLQRSRDHVDKLKEALTEISCPTQTDKLLWWQARARQALGEP